LYDGLFDVAPDGKHSLERNTPGKLSSQMPRDPKRVHQADEFRRLRGCLSLLATTQHPDWRSGHTGHLVDLDRICLPPSYYCL
jgi:hypothetical protein